jgi:molecular chaperone DnaJ
MLPGQECPGCKGNGVTKKKKTIAVKIPPPVSNNDTIRLRGLGYPGKDGGPKGDLIVKVKIMGEEKFSREGNNIRTSVEITFPQAALGAKVPVQALAKKLMVNIPAGTQPGTVMRLRGAGLAVGDKTGDLLVTINIIVPAKLSDRQKELLREFDEIGEKVAG